jgi:drug/metabolite transporter (DMT)-like permease
MLSWWTIGRASGIGVTAALAGLLLWPFYGGEGDPLERPFLAAAAVSGLCGASILLITVLDLAFHRPRGDRVRPLRAFDLVMAAGLILLAFVFWNEVARSASYTA